MSITLPVILSYKIVVVRTLLSQMVIYICINSMSDHHAALQIIAHAKTITAVLTCGRVFVWTTEVFIFKDMFFFENN